jgi:hypothetical protein
MTAFLILVLIILLHEARVHRWGMSNEARRELEECDRRLLAEREAQRRTMEEERDTRSVRVKEAQQPIRWSEDVVKPMF